MNLRISDSRNTLISPLYKNELGQPLEAYEPVLSMNKRSNQLEFTGAGGDDISAGTYYFKIVFRTRGDRNPTKDDCSTVCFKCLFDHQIRSFSHSLSEAYNEIGKIVSWTYSYTVDEDVMGNTSLGINSFSDTQTVDIYYYKLWDSKGNVYFEKGTYFPLLEVEDKVNHKLYFTPLVQESQLPNDYPKIMKFNDKYFPMPMPVPVPSSTTESIEDNINTTSSSSRPPRPGNN